MDVYDVLADAGAPPDHPGSPDSRRRENTFATADAQRVADARAQAAVERRARAKKLVADRLKGKDR